MNPDRSVCVEWGRKAFHDVLLATEGMLWLYLASSKCRKANQVIHL